MDMGADGRRRAGATAIGRRPRSGPGCAPGDPPGGYPAVVGVREPRPDRRRGEERP